MVIATKTLKLAFHRLNQSKQDEFVRLQAINTQLANQILLTPKKDRKNITTAAFKEIELGSAWVNQTIRNAKANTNVKKFKNLPLETNNQNWTLHKVGNTYSVAFGLIRGVRKRIPLQVDPAVHQLWLDAILEGNAKQGTIKITKSKRGIWYALLSVSMEVPDAVETGTWTGVDRGQNIPAVAALPDNGRLVFFQAKQIQHIRREKAKRRAKLQKLGKKRVVKKMEQREKRTVTHINHTISKRIVSLAKRHNTGLRLEDLSGIRKSRQRKKTKSDAGKNRDFWPYYQLETFCKYKSELSSVAFEKVPAAYTSKTHHKCGRIGVRDKHDFYCSHCDRHEHADGNAARNIGGYVGMFCEVEFSADESSKGVSVEGISVHPYGLPGTALRAKSDDPDAHENSVREADPQGSA